MADNVMALVKKKGSQKKLRGKAAQRQKAWAAAAATARPKSMADKRNPFRPFRYMEPSEMIEELAAENVKLNVSSKYIEIGGL